jgi:alkylhydroperoxidase family enzyme
VTEGHVPDAVYEIARKQFSEEELIDLTLAVTTINAWNRISIAFRTEAGTYRPPTLAAHRAE